MINFAHEKEASAKVAQAIAGGNQKEIQEAWQGFHASIVEQLREDMELYNQTQDKDVLMQRGYRQLTTEETKWYQKLIDAAKSPNPQQKFTTIIGTDLEDDIMPTTILEDVYRDLEDNHPLLSVINFQYVGYATKWILNDHTVQTAVWGQITAEITKEITSGFRVIDVTQNKLSAYAMIERGMLDLGPTFLDAYIRRVLYEALANGLEYGIVKGTGKNEPIGLIKDIHEGVSVSSGVYPDKSTGNGKETVTDFTPASYGKLVGKLAKTENGHQRIIRNLTMLCTPSDYYTKVMPATTVLNAHGTYVNNLFPVPTQVIQTTQLTDGQAILFLPGEYGAFAGGSRQGTLEFSDEFKFLEDMRVFKIKQYADGRATDNTAALLLDISGLEPAYINVKGVGVQDVNVTNDKIVTETTPAA